MTTGKTMLIDAHTVAIEAPDGSQTLINLQLTSQAVELYLLLVNSGIDHLPAPKETNHGY